MPEISRFYGIVIKMYFVNADHNPPHFHVEYSGSNAELDIQTLKVLAGSLPTTALELARRWAADHREELLRIWNTQEFVKIKPLD